MSVTKQEWQKEQERLDRVTAKIGKRMDDLKQRVSGLKSEIVNIRKNFWDDVRVNVDEPHEAVETAVSVKQQSEVLAERERSFRHVNKELSILSRMRKSPWFGRIDFREDGEQETEKIYLGIASFRDENDEDFLVYDWRAPVSSLYYEGVPGPVQYETPGGTVTGTLELKRQYIIRNGKIVSLFDTGVTIGDELLQEVLGKHSDAQMKSIVATIQKEQNRIIRSEGPRLLIVQGAAGSGKTSTALQRVAWLLYRYRGSLTADQIVLFSPNPMFNSYVSTVLPELGEENMQQTTFQELLEKRIGNMFELEDPFTQMEYVLTAMDDPEYSARIEGIRYKTSVSFMNLIDRYIAYLGQDGMLFHDLKLEDEVLIPADYIREQFYSLPASLAIHDRMSFLAERLLEDLKERARLERSKPWVEEEIQYLDRHTLIRAYQTLQKQKRFTMTMFDDFEREREFLAAFVVHERFRPLRQSVKRLEFVDIAGIYRQLFADPDYVARFAPEIRLPDNWKTICAQTVKRLDRGKLSCEDATPLMYLKEQIEGFETDNTIRHVFVDEAQDYSPFQFAFVKRLYPRARMTVLGDFNQVIFAHAAAGDVFQALPDLFGTDEVKTFILLRSYRSTRQIVEFTRQLIDGGEAIEPFHREGPKPTLTQVADRNELAKRIADRIRSLQDAGHQTIAVICKTARESREAYEVLKDQVPIRLIGKDSVSFEKGALIIPAYLAKGIEFDAVIIFNASEDVYGKESERKLFYTACTRAMHELHIYWIGNRSPFLAQVSPDLYVTEK
ncbi:RNA polymerase recycling motor HelD [Polycladomyces subterraneus]|uniref:UvrD-helicase domain-containing protein n=1 Tax=Polycladomyces subterraneus TaxID=1016997 RepID=A0ABT8IRI6_9BACL|nr:RNA polymerase recycling motor HelD [Polycladomyces subterraneus]MDN4595392.1 UvrD-helicase domain-containing protein [Polycladomyces subterraneus]